MGMWNHTVPDLLGSIFFFSHYSVGHCLGCCFYRFVPSNYNFAVWTHHSLVDHPFLEGHLVAPSVLYGSVKSTVVLDFVWACIFISLGWKARVAWVSCRFGSRMVLVSEISTSCEWLTHFLCSPVSFGCYSCSFKQFCAVIYPIIPLICTSLVAIEVTYLFTYLFITHVIHMSPPTFILNQGLSM